MNKEGGRKGCPFVLRIKQIKISRYPVEKRAVFGFFKLSEGHLFLPSEGEV